MHLQPSTRQRTAVVPVSYHACDEYECPQKQRVAGPHVRGAPFGRAVRVLLGAHGGVTQDGEDGALAVERRGDLRGPEDTPRLGNRVPALASLG